MRFVRLDRLAGGRPLELHPRLTVLVGAPADVLAALADAARAVVAGGPVPFDGQVELHGIRVPLRGRSFDVDAGAQLDPVLDLSESRTAPERRSRTGGEAHAPVPGSAAARAVAGAGAGAGGPGPLVEMVSIDDDRPGPDVPPPAGTPLVAAGTRTEARGHTVGSVTDAADEADPTTHTRRAARDDLMRLRAELRSLQGERHVLDRRVAEVRADLDSFARATLEVVLGQLEAIESRQAAPPAEPTVTGTARRRAELDERIDRLRAEIARSGASEPRTHRRGTDAVVIAERLDRTRGALHELRARRRVDAGRLAEVEAELAALHEEPRPGPRSGPHGGPDRGAVADLEALRSEIIDLEEEISPVDPSLARRRLRELRVEEAVLLDRLGYETYSAFLVDTVDPRRRLDTGPDLAATRHKVEEEAEQLRRSLDDVEDLDRLVADQERCVADAAALLATPVEALSRLTTSELVGLLRRADRGTPAAAAAGPTVEALRLELDAAERERASIPDDGGASEPPTDDEEVVVLQRRVAECTERAERHERASTELSELRRLADRVEERERDCLARISDRERLLHLLDTQDASPDEAEGVEADRAAPRIIDAVAHVAVTAASDTAAPLIGVPDTADRDSGSHADAPGRRPGPGGSPLQDRSGRSACDRDWRLLARLGELRSVGSVGAVPLLLSGIDPASGDDALMRRVATMSDLVQIVVHGDGEHLERWALGLGEDALLVHW